MPFAGEGDESTITIGIGIPVYNAASFIEETLNSVIAQDVADMEVVVSDNCSTDGTFEICQRFALLDPRVRVFRNSRNIGAPQNYNFVFRRSRGRYFKWAAASDICGEGFLSGCIETLERHPSAVLAFPQTLLFADSIADAKPYRHDPELVSNSPVDRFREFLGRVRLNNVMNGVIRRSVLQSTALHGDYLSSDVVLVAELAIHGQFLRSPRGSFLRRMTPEATANLRPRSEMLAHWAPETGISRYQNWKTVLGLMAAVHRANGGVHAAAGLYGQVLKQAAWNRSNLIRELIAPWGPASRS